MIYNGKGASELMVGDPRINGMHDSGISELLVYVRSG